MTSFIKVYIYELSYDKMFSRLETCIKDYERWR